MDTIWLVLSQPFVWGLALGLLVAAFLWKSGFSDRGNLKRENKRIQEEMRELQRHLNTHLKISATGNEQLQKELATLKEQNENLRVNLASLQQKPGRAEIRQLQILEAAAGRMREQAPGFASAWEQALRQAASDVESAEGGFSKLMRKVLPGGGGPVRAEEAEKAEKIPLIPDKEG